MKKHTEKKFNVKQLVLFFLVVALAGAVYLNWRTANKADLAVSASDLAENIEITEREKYYGEAEFVSSNTTEYYNDYFSQARLTREQTRDDALDTLGKSLQQANLSQDEKDMLTASVSSVTAGIALEGDIETLVKAKGFADCVAFLNDDSAKVVVGKSEGELTSEDVSRITEIVVAVSGVATDKITIVEVK